MSDREILFCTVYKLINLGKKCAIEKLKFESVCLNFALNSFLISSLILSLIQEVLQAPLLCCHS